MEEKKIIKKSVLVGYQRKPLWIFLFALAIIWLPFIAFFLAIGDDWANSQSWPTYISRIPPLSWLMVILLFSSGLSILFVKKFSLLLLLTVIILITAVNIIYFKQIPVPVIIIGLIIAIPPFRRPFLNPRLRWWERNERLMAIGRRVLLGHQQTSLEIYDISISGAFVNFTPIRIPVKAQQKIDITLEQGLHLKAKIMRVAENGFALHFVDMDKDKKILLENYMMDIKSKSL